MEKKLSSILKKNKGKVLFVGIGNVLRKDDGACVYIVQHINETPLKSKLLAEVSIENYIKKINRLNPGILVLVDCIDFNRKPGHYDMITIDDTHEYSLNSHHISLKRLSGFFKMPTWVIGIQPADLGVGENLSRDVLLSASKIIKMINELN